MSKKKNRNKHTQNSKNNSKYFNGFFAFPSEPTDRKKIIETAILLVNEHANMNQFKIISWTKMDKSSSRIISNILESIKISDILIADISGLNPNVLFELGFAFGMGKKVLLFTQGNSTNEREKDISDIELISGLEIDSYENGEQLASKILSHMPEIFINREADIYKYGYNPEINKKVSNRGFFLKGITNHPIGLAAETSFKSIYSNYAIDDWKEDISQNLMFYIKELEKASGVVALFVDKVWDESRKVNARFSFICGMALAMDRNVLMIGLPGFKSPFDYKDILVSPKDEEKSRQAILDRFKANSESPTVNQLLPNSISQQKDTSKDIHYSIQTDSVNISSLNSLTNNDNSILSKEDKEIILIDINIGNSIAENEEHELAEYFVKTGQYYSALSAKQAIIIGAKGSGKTASFYQIRDFLRNSNPKNLVCEIKPSDYKMERFLGSLKILDEGKGLIGHVLENVWKTIVYTSILDTIYKELEKRPIFIEYSSDEKKLIDFVLLHQEIISSPFEQKLEKACNWLHEVGMDVDNFSKKIHSELLSQAKSILLPILCQKNKIVILIDNLDKAWEANSNLNLQAQLFFNLLGMHRRLHADFNIDNVSVLIYIRRNIYEYILNNVAREPDKLNAETIELEWNDKDVLLRVLEDRFVIASSYWDRTVEDVWSTFFKWNNKNISLKEWLYNSILPRPRDLIRFIQKAIEIAISLEHSEIQEEDLEKALISYSGFALEQIIAEYKAEEPWIVNFLNSFIGENSVFSFNRLADKIRSNSSKPLDSQQIVDRIITLISINFIGVRLNETPVIYAYNIQEGRKLSSIIKDTTLNKHTTFIIHPVFYHYLNIKDGEQELSVNKILRFIKKIFKS